MPKFPPEPTLKHKPMTSLDQFPSIRSGRKSASVHHSSLYLTSPGVVGYRINRREVSVAGHRPVEPESEDSESS